MNRVDPAREAPFQNAGPGARLQAGVSLSLRVLGPLGSSPGASPGTEGLHRVEIGGQVLVARLEVGSGLAAPAPGGRFTALVVQAAPPPLSLRLVEGPLEASCLYSPGPALPVPSIPPNPGLPLDQVTRLAALALLSEGRPASGPPLSRLSRVVSQAREGTREAAAERGAALEARGLGAEADLVEAILEAAASSGRGSSGRGEGEGGGGPKEGPDRAEAAVTEELPVDQAMEGLAAFLKARMTACATTADRGQVGLGLFNHARASGEHWVDVPFAFSLDTVAFWGNFRIVLPYLAGGPGRILADFRTERPRGGRGLEDGPSPQASAWRLELDFGQGEGALALGRFDPGADNGTLAEALRVALGDEGPRVRVLPGDRPEGDHGLAGGVSLHA